MQHNASKVWCPAAGRAAFGTAGPRGLAAGDELRVSYDRGAVISAATTGAAGGQPGPAGTRGG